MHADRSVDAVVDQHDYDRQVILNGGCELLPVHEKIAVARETDDCPPRKNPRRADCRRQAKPHRAGCGPDLLFDPAKAQEPAGPDGEVAGSGGEDGVRHAPPQREHDFADLNPAGVRRRLLAPGEIIRPRLTRLGGPGNGSWRLYSFQSRAELRRSRDNSKGRGIIAPDLMRVRVNMDKALPRRWNVKERVTLSGRLRHAPADEH